QQFGTGPQAARCARCSKSCRLLREKRNRHGVGGIPITKIPQLGPHLLSCNRLVDSSGAELHPMANYDVLNDSSSVFELAPISLWLEDYSGLRKQFDEWRAEGITDLKAFLEEDHK